MILNILDAIVIAIILICGLSGLKKGFTKELVSFLGLFVCLILAFLLKNPVSVFLYEHLPFFSFFGIFKGIEVLNILLYEIIAFIIVLSVLTIILKVLLMVTSVIEKLLTITVVLGIPSKILGFIIGLVEGFVWSFALVYVVSLPLFNLDFIKESKFREEVLKNAPLLSNFTSSFTEATDEFSNLKDEYKASDNTKESKDKFNRDSLDVFLKYRIIDKKSVKLLKDKNKLTFSGIDDIIDKY